MRWIGFVSAFLFSIGVSAGDASGGQGATSSSTLKSGQSCNVPANAECADEKPASLPPTCEDHHAQAMKLCSKAQIDQLIQETDPAATNAKATSMFTAGGPQMATCSLDLTRESHGKVLKRLKTCQAYLKGCVSYCGKGAAKAGGAVDPATAAKQCKAVDPDFKRLVKHQEGIAKAAKAGSASVTSRGGAAPAAFGAKCAFAPEGGFDPEASPDQPEGGADDKYAGGGDGDPAGAGGDQAGEGGGGGDPGIGQLLSSLLPLAMMAAMQDDDDDPQEEEVDPIAAFCAENPTSQVCVSEVDCSNEEVAALNPQQCLCADPAVARVTPICNQNPLPTNTAGLLETATSDNRNGLLGSSGLTDLLSSNPAVLPVEGGAVGVDANQRGGGGGGPNAAGGPAAKMETGGGGGHGPGPYNTDIMKGVGRSGGGGGAAAGGGGFRYAGGSSEDGGDESNFNLQKYLPENTQRGLAGVNGATNSGLTGPFGPSIWQKVSLRYKKVQPFLKQ